MSILLRRESWGAWVTQWVKASAFSSGHDLRVLGSSPTSGSLLSREPASPLSLPPSLPTCDLSLLNKVFKKKFRGTWVAQWVKASAFVSGHDPRVLGSSPALGSLLSTESNSSPSLSLPASLPTCDLCQINKILKKKERNSIIKSVKPKASFLKNK